MNVSHKIRHFAWRAAKDILPTKANLVHRHVLLDDTCEECGLMAKSMVHFFFGNVLRLITLGCYQSCFKLLALCTFETLWIFFGIY